MSDGVGPCVRKRFPGPRLKKPAPVRLIDHSTSGLCANVNIVEISRLKEIQEIVDTISHVTTQQTVSSTPSLAPLSNSFELLIHKFQEEYQSLKLDDVIVGAIGQIVSH